MRGTPMVALGVKIHLQREAVPLLREMAKEAGLSISDMAEIAVYNLIGVWQRDRGIGEVADDTHSSMEPDK